jgi:hypothetical protein
MKDRKLPFYGPRGSTRYNEKADQAAKEALDEDNSITEIYPPDDLKKWLTEEYFKKRDQRWKNGNNDMKERKPGVDRKEECQVKSNIHTQNWVYEGHPRPQDGRGQQSTMPLL